MLDQIVSKMVLDRACNVCGGHKYVKPKPNSLEFMDVPCKSCNGRGYLSDSSNASVLLINDRKLIPLGLHLSMKNQNLFVVDRCDYLPEAMRGRKFSRLYALDIPTDSALFQYTLNRMSYGPTEIHLYFSGN